MRLRALHEHCRRLGGIFSQQWFRGAAATEAGYISFPIFFHFCSVRFIFQYSFFSGDE